MLLMDSRATSQVPYFSLAMLVPKADMLQQCAVSQQLASRAHSRLLVASFLDLPQPLQEAWMGAMRRVGVMFPPTPASVTIDSNTFAAMHSACVHPPPFAPAAPVSVHVPTPAAAPASALLNSVSGPLGRPIKPPKAGNRTARAAKPGRQLVEKVK